MGSLQTTAVCLLFLSIFSSAAHSSLATFNCNGVKTEYNKTATISCIGSKNITDVIVMRCENCNKQNSCLETVNTWRKRKCSEDRTGNCSREDGRIRLVLQHNVSVLHIQEVKATDQGSYIWHLYSESGEGNECTTLEITGPEIEPNLTRTGAKLACLSPLGHRQRQIHWFDGHGNNLTSSASLVSEEAEGGLTSLTSTLDEKPSAAASEYCCTVLYDAHTKRSKTKCLSADKAVADYHHFTSIPEPKILKEHVATILVLLILVLCCFAAVLYYKYRQRAVDRWKFAGVLRNLRPLLRQYEKTEENAPNQEV